MKMGIIPSKVDEKPRSHFLFNSRSFKSKFNYLTRCGDIATANEILTSCVRQIIGYPNYYDDLIHELEQINADRTFDSAEVALSLVKQVKCELDPLLKAMDAIDGLQFRDYDIQGDTVTIRLINRDFMKKNRAVDNLKDNENVSTTMLDQFWGR